VRSNQIIILPPVLDQDPRFDQVVKDLAIEQLISELAIERLHVTVLPGTTGFDEQGLDTDLLQPATHGPRLRLE
jgi:hypothetical protein